MTNPPSDGRVRHDARLLVVEDEPNILELLAASLRYAGFEVITAAGGTEAVQSGGVASGSIVSGGTEVVSASGVVSAVVISTGVGRICTWPFAPCPE